MYIFSLSVSIQASELHIWALLLDSLHSIGGVYTVVHMLLHTSSNGQHIGTKDNVLKRELHLVHQNDVRPSGNAHLLSFSRNLTILVESRVSRVTSSLHNSSPTFKLIKSTIGFP
jgi:hypothetical protein